MSMSAKQSQIKTVEAMPNQDSAGVAQALWRPYIELQLLPTVKVSPTSFDLVNMLQKKALTAFPAPIFPQNCGKPCGLL